MERGYAGEKPFFKKVFPRKGNLFEKRLPFPTNQESIIVFCVFLDSVEGFSKVYKKYIQNFKRKIWEGVVFMKIIVLAKQVPDPNKTVGMTEWGTVDRERSVPIMNPYDGNALEAALQLREKHGGRITVISMGPPKAKDMLKDALALGADEVILLSDKRMAASDTLATAYALSQAIRRLGRYDIILAGMQAIDGDTAQVGPQLAERLGIPHVTYVEEITVNSDNTITIRRVIEGGYEIVKTQKPYTEMPVLLTITNTANTLRLPSLRGKLRAKKKPVTVWDVEDIEPDEANYNLYGMKGSPTRVKKIERPVSEKVLCKIFENMSLEEQVDALFKEAGLDMYATTV